MLFIHLVGVLGRVFSEVSLNHESWVVPAGVSSALAVFGGVKLWKHQSFCSGGVGFGVLIPPWSGQSCVRKG